MDEFNRRRICTSSALSSPNAGQFLGLTIHVLLTSVSLEISKALQIVLSSTLEANGLHQFHASASSIPGQMLQLHDQGISHSRICGTREYLNI